MVTFHGTSYIIADMDSHDTRGQRIALIGCGKKKADTPQKAINLYTGNLFRLSVQYARHMGCDRIFIMSALHGLVPAEKVIAPYNLKLSELSAAQVRKWGERVLHQIRSVSDPRVDFYLLLAGEQYIKNLRLHLDNHLAPLTGKPLGIRLAWMKHQVAQETNKGETHGQGDQEAD